MPAVEASSLVSSLRYKRKTMARSWPPVSNAKCWMRSIVEGSLRSETVEGESSRSRSWRDERVLPVLGSTCEERGSATSCVFKSFSMIPSACLCYKWSSQATDRVDRATNARSTCRGWPHMISCAARRCRTCWLLIEVQLRCSVDG